MRWKRKYHRIIKRLALFPIHVDDEYRWFEIVYVKQTLKWSYGYGYYWRSDCFVSKDEYLDWKAGRKNKNGICT